jgi:hypothetical protein
MNQRRRRYLHESTEPFHGDTLMRTHLKRFPLMFGLSWVAAAAMVTMKAGRYGAEDFTLPDLTPVFLMLAVFGLPLTAIVALPALLFLRRRLSGASLQIVPQSIANRSGSMRSAILYPLVSALLVLSLPAVASLFGVFIFESMTASEAIMFTGAFTLIGLIFGLAFLQLYGETWARRWWTTVVCLLIAICATVATSTILP